MLPQRADITDSAPIAEPTPTRPISGTFPRGHAASHQTRHEATLIEEVCDVAPHHHARAVRMKRRHRSLLRRRALLDSQYQALVAERDLVLRSIVEHEAAEVALLQDALLTDLGVGD